MHFKNVMLTMFIVLISTTSAVLANDTTIIQVHVVDAPKNTQKVYGQLLEGEAPKSCKSGIILEFSCKKGFVKTMFIASDVGIKELSVVDTGLGKGVLSLDKKSDKKITFCVPESVYDEGSFEYTAQLTETIFLWWKDKKLSNVIEENKSKNVEVVFDNEDDKMTLAIITLIITVLLAIGAGLYVLHIRANKYY